MAEFKKIKKGPGGLKVELKCSGGTEVKIEKVAFVKGGEECISGNLKSCISER